MRLTRMLWLALFMLFLLQLANLKAQDEATAQAYRTVNVRQGPGSQHNIIGQLISGDIVLITGRSDVESNWLRINFDNGEGWIAFFTVSVNGQLDALPIIDTERVSDGSIGNIALSSSFISEDQYVDDPYVIAFRRVNVRVGPGSNFSRFGYMNPGNVADLQGRTDDNEWLEINFNGQSGWVAFFVVSINGDLENIPVVAHPAELQVSPTPTIRALTTPIEVQITTTFNSNLRIAPEFSSEVITVVPYGSLLVAEARTANSSWLRVTYNGETGWLIASLAQVRNSTRAAHAGIDALPIVQD